MRGRREGCLAPQAGRDVYTSMPWLWRFLFSLRAPLQVLLINAVKDVASALSDLISATKNASGKPVSDPAMLHLKDSAKVRAVPSPCLRSGHGLMPLSCHSLSHPSAFVLTWGFQFSCPAHCPMPPTPNLALPPLPLLSSPVLLSTLSILKPLKLKKMQ